MSNKASLTSAASSIFGAVSTVAETTGNLVSDIASSADMFTAMIKRQKERQADRHILDKEFYRTELIAEYNERISQKTLELSEKFAENPDFEKLYLENQTKLEALFTSK